MARVCYQTSHTSSEAQEIPISTTNIDQVLISQFLFACNTMLSDQLELKGFSV